MHYYKDRKETRNSVFPVSVIIPKKSLLLFVRIFLVDVIFIAYLKLELLVHSVLARH